MSIFHHRLNKQIAKYQRELIDTHYQEVNNMYKNMRGWRHDYKNHIQTLKILLEGNDIQGAKIYLSKLEQDLINLDLAIKTGNKMADAIINSKLSLAKAKDIEVKIDAQIPVELKMSELDLCVIIANLFDNAIEASMRLPIEKRKIRVYLAMKNTQLYISFTNFTSEKKMKKIFNLYQTKKGDGHGFGLLRIDKIVKKMGGYISRNSEDNAFTTEILLPQE